MKTNKGDFYAKVTRNNNGYRWQIFVNSAHADHQNAPIYFTVPKGQKIDPKSIRIYQTEPNDYLAPVVEGTSKSLEEAIRKLSFGSKGNVAHVPVKQGNFTVDKPLDYLKLSKITLVMFTIPKSMVILELIFILKRSMPLMKLDFNRDKIWKINSTTKGD